MERTSSADGKIAGFNDEWDVYSPASTTSRLNVHGVAVVKVYKQNAPDVIIRLEPGGQSVEDIAEYFKRNLIQDLKQLFVIKDGKIHIVY